AFVRVEDENKFIYYMVAKPTTAYTPESITATASADRNYFINTEKVKANATLNTAVMGTLSTATPTEEEYAAACKDYFMGEAQTAVYEKYHSDVKTKTSFLWIKNIWATDASFKSPVLEYADFKTAIAQRSGCGSCGSCGSCGTAENEELTGNPYDEATYNIVTGKLSAEKDAPNGYYILIVLSIGTILLQQFLSMRSNKAQNQYSSVDGQGAMSQKTMMIMMTVMFAVFSFMYSAAFSVYLVVGNLLSMVSTLVINKAVDVSLRKKEEAALQAKYNQRFPGRKPLDGDKKKKQ
ncbi:MAG: YidC/Oxa1 family membrane protein insertase, partial [Clostridia bacterium]|nr:YidC/Oxa1 family membrane protein insertase [Clostridia bacterium]